MENKRLKIGVLGLGLIGGSILKALNSLNKFYLVAVSNSSYIKASEFADVSTKDIKALIGCDVIFVCSKMKDTREILDNLNDILDEKTIVADVCSIKGFLNKNYKFNFIPSHPMAGTEFSGFEHSFKELFQDAAWVLGKENDTLEEIIKLMGARVLILNPELHDSFAAQISHLPMLISFALFNSTEDKAKKIASSGFRDTTRLALTNPDLAFDMLNFNKKNIEAAYENFVKEFERIKSMNEEEFKEFVLKVAKNRSKMYDKNGKNTF